MGYGLYNGSSEGFEMVTDGYIDYAQNVIVKRSIPDLRDGLKPVARRILYSIKTTVKTEGLSKCGTLVGRAMELHPHGDSSIYGALCGMTDINGSYNVPLFDGQGEFGRVFSSDTPAAMRYTKAKLNSNSMDYFRDLAACELVQSEEGEGFEPVVLPVRYPSVLVNGTSGLAVGVATWIPSFNFHEVIDMTILGLKIGFGNLSNKIDILVPDFPTGGVLVKDDTELAKIMLAGKGKLKIRANVEIAGREIIVKEVPYGRTVEGIKKAIMNFDIPGITDVQDTTGFKSTGLLSIQCRSKKVVESVLLELYRRRILQNTVNCNMLIIDNGVPEILGVYKILEKWVDWRREICKKRIQKELDGIKDELDTLSYFLKLINNEEWRDTYIHKIVKVSKKEATAYLKEILEGISDDACSWISERSISAFNNDSRYSKRYSTLASTRDTCNGYLADIDSYIISDLESLKREKAGQFARKTISSNKDYKFISCKTAEIEDDSYCCYFLKKDGFLVKTRDEYGVDKQDVVCTIHGAANSVLIGFDNAGRILRVYGYEIPFTPEGGAGEFLPKYFGLVDDGTNSDIISMYKILYLGLLDGSRKALLYKDGFIGTFDTSEYVGKKRIRVVMDGVDVRVFDRLLEVLDWDDIPEYIMFADDHGEKTRFGLVEKESIPIRGRRTRAKVLSGSDINANYYALMSVMDLYKFTTNPTYYMGRMKTFKDIVGDTEAFKEGRYFVESAVLKDKE